MSLPLSRRRMLKLSASALLAAGIWPGRLRAAATATQPLRFIVVNDLHYAEDACAPFFEAMVRAINDLPNLALVLVVGDQADAGTAGQCHAIHDILTQLKVPFYVTPGNHDWRTQTDRAPFEYVFGKKFNLTFETGGWQFVGLDTSDGTKYENVECHKETLDFTASLASTLDKNKPTFIYTHFPLGPEVKYRLVNADALLEPFKPFNLQAIFNGHYHAFTEKKVLSNVIVTTNRCCSRKRANHDNTREKGFFLIEAADGTYKRTFVEFGTDWPGGAQVNPTRPATTRPS